MEAVFQWVKSLAYYLILVSLLSNLIPNGKYDRYIRLFTGAVFILLVIRPLSGGLGLEEKMAYAYEKIRLKQDTSEFESRLWGMEKERTQQVIIQYEAAVAQDIKRMAFDAGLVCKEARAVIESDPENEKFGQVKGLSLVLERGGKDAGMAEDTGLSGRTETSEPENGQETSKEGENTPESTTNPTDTNTDETVPENGDTQNSEKDTTAEDQEGAADTDNTQGTTPAS